MPTHHPSGFSVSLGVVAHEQGVASQHLRVLPEICATIPSAEATPETFCYVQAAHPKQPFRAFIERQVQLKPLVSLEAYVVLLSVDGARPWTKVYACGAGVAPPLSSPWYLDGEFGDEPEGGLAGTVGKQVVVEVHPCRVKEGVALGTGHLLASDVAAMSQEPASKFLFQYLTSAEHVSALGLHLPSPLGVPSTSGAASNPAHPTPPFHSDIEAAHGPANSFLRRANSLLLSLLTPAQKLQFLSALYDSPSLAPLLSTGVKDDLNTATLRLTAEILAEAPPRGTFPTPVSATSLPANDTPSFNPASRLPAAALATTRRASPIDTTSGLHLRPPPIRSPSKPVRIGSPRKSPLSVHVSTEQAADGVEVSGGEAARKEVLGAEGEGSKEN